MESEFPPNSHTSKERPPARRAEKGAAEVPERKQVKQITRGKVRTRKRPLRKKVMDAFRPEDGAGFIEHTILEVLIPSIQDAMVDAGQDAVASVFSGGRDTRGRRRRSGGGGRGYTSYSSMSQSRPRDRRDRDDDRRGSRRDEREKFDLRDVIFDTRVEAEETLDALITLTDQYGAATKRDLFGLIGEPHNPVDEDWGWRDGGFRGARIHNLGRNDGYLLDLPRPEYLD